jgi:hypothetical protein
LKIDSDEAIAIALKEPMLERLTILATELRLERAGGKGGGDEALPDLAGKAVGRTVESAGTAGGHWRGDSFGGGRQGA